MTVSNIAYSFSQYTGRGELLSIYLNVSNKILTEKRLKQEVQRDK